MQAENSSSSKSAALPRRSERLDVHNCSVSSIALQTNATAGGALKVLFVLSVSPYPKNIGKRIMLGGICDYLKQSPNVSSICVASFAGRDMSAGLEHTIALPRPSSRRRISNALWYSLARRSKSLQESFFWNPRAQEKLDSLVEQFQPNLIIYDTLRTGQYGKGHSEERNLNNAVEVIYMDDLFSVRYSKMLSLMKEQGMNGIDAMGNFGANIPGVLLRICQKYPVVQKLLLHVERSLVAASENEAPARFDRALLVSSVERDILRLRTDAENIFTLPPRLDSFSISRRAWNGTPEFVFLGSLNLAHNTISIETFLEQNLETLRQQIPGIKISVIGGGAGENLKRLAALYPENVVLHGFVKDLDEVLLRACAMISPLTFGSGVKLKVIDSLRCGIPLITTSHGIEGIEVGNSSGVLKRDVNGFPAAMLSLLDPTINAVCSRDNAELYRRFYSSAAVDRVYGRTLLGIESSSVASNQIDSAAS
jgi:polysaccharide biosynthesis protein PslH